MPRHLLSHRDVDGAKKRDAAYRLADGDGLYLRVAPTGVKSWQLRYSLPGDDSGTPRETIATLGRYPTVSLAAARTAAEEARGKASKGMNISVARKVAKASKAASHRATFKTVAADWVDDEARRRGWGDDYRLEVERSITNHLHKLSGLPVAEVTAAMCSPITRSLERRAPDMAAKVGQRLHAIMDYAVERGLIDRSPLPKRRPQKLDRAPYPAQLKRDAVGAILRAADAADVGKGVRRAHALLVFTAQRVGEIVPAEWGEIDLAAGTWTLPRDRMKMKNASRGDHIVPIPPLLLGQMREWKRADGDDATYVCPSPHTDAAITREAMEKFYRVTLGLANTHSPHSWRSVLSTWARDAGKDGDLIESQLDHLIGTKVESVYDRAKRVERRRELMEWHESSLLAARDGAKVVSMRSGKLA